MLKLYNEFSINIKNTFFANLKKYCFHQDETYFLEYVISSKNINIDVKKTKVVKNWPEPKSV